MSVNLCVEIDPRLGFEEMRGLFEAAGFVDIEPYYDVSVEATCPGSGMGVSADRYDGSEDLFVEDVDSPDRWKLGSQVTFFYRFGMPDVCKKEVADFLKVLSSASPAYFVFSFQHENVYAIRDSGGLRFLDGSGYEQYR